MKRRNFIATTSLAFPIVGMGIYSCNPDKKNIPGHKPLESGVLADDMVQKALQAMLCMQRMAWEQGTASQALIAIGRKDLAMLFAKDAVVRQTDDGRLGILGNDPGVTDPASNGEAVLLAYKETGDEKFKKAADAMYNYLKHTAPKTKDGILYHFNHEKPVWSDAAFMAPPFLALMGDYDEAVKQIEGFRKYLLNPENKLYYHQWDEGKNDFTRKLCWGGGNGWTASGIAKIINLLPVQREDLKSKLISYGKELVDACIVFMRQDGLFHDIIDDNTSFVETNLGQMLAYTIYTAVKAGWLDKSYKEKADIMRQAARSKIDEFGIIQGACGSPTFDKVGTSTEAQSFFLMMESAYHSF